MTRIALIDGHRLFRATFRHYVESTADLTVVAEAGTSAEAHLALEAEPEVIVVELRLGGASGCALAQALKRQARTIQVLFLTGIARPEAVAAAFVSGGLGYALKSDDPSSVLDGIRMVAEGRRYLSPAIPERAVEEVLRAWRTSEARGGAPDQRLSPRELEVFSLLARGLANEVIGARLHISRRTVETHRARIYEKLDVHSVADLIREAYTFGPFDDDDREVVAEHHGGEAFAR
jgi:DNA-binding NarL/FixJ family response regulator